MSLLNELAVKLAVQIEKGLINDHIISRRVSIRNADVSSQPISSPSPGRYNLRRSILDVLCQYMGEIGWEINESDYMLEGMTQEQIDHYTDHQHKKLASELVEKVINDSEFFHKAIYSDNLEGEMSSYVNKRFTIPIIKAGKLMGCKEVESE